MKGLASLTWDFMSDSSMYFQNTLSTKWLIIWGIVALVIAISGAVLSSKDKNEEDNIWIVLLSIVSFLSVYGSVFFIGLNEFKNFANANSEFGYYCIIIMLISILSLIVISAVNGTIHYAIAFIVCLLLSAFLFSKFVVGLGILLGIGVFAGGSSYIGTFTDKNGNSYDIYKKN
jgi:hypothetical protein